jgi:hypothetical protein
LKQHRKLVYSVQLIHYPQRLKVSRFNAENPGPVPVSAALISGYPIGSVDVLGEPWPSESNIAVQIATAGGIQLCPEKLPLRSGVVGNRSLPGRMSNGS